MELFTILNTWKLWHQQKIDPKNSFLLQVQHTFTAVAKLFFELVVISIPLT